MTRAALTACKQARGGGHARITPVLGQARGDCETPPSARLDIQQEGRGRGKRASWALQRDGVPAAPATHWVPALREHRSGGSRGSVPGQLYPPRHFQLESRRGTRSSAAGRRAGRTGYKARVRRLRPPPSGPHRGPSRLSLRCGGAGSQGGPPPGPPAALPPAAHERRRAESLLPAAAAAQVAPWLQPT